MRYHPDSYDWAAAHQRRRLVLGLCFVVAGVLALLGNLHIIQIGQLRDYWPLVFCAIGLSKLLQRRHLPAMLFGLGFIAMGIGLTLQNLGLVQHVMALLVPAFLILAGLAVMARGLRPQRFERTRADQGRFGPMGEPVVAHDDSVQLSATMSGIHRRCDSQDFQGGTLNVVMGGIELDLRQAAISSQATLRVNVVGGGIKLRIPQDWQLQLQVSPVLGGVEDKTIPPMHGGKVLQLQGEVVLGGIEIGH